MFLPLFLTDKQGHETVLLAGLHLSSPATGSAGSRGSGVVAVVMEAQLWYLPASELHSVYQSSGGS